ncbi:hypothetical protein ACG93R_22265 [Acinetobacter guillouiae]|uniref:hypothetical protein n=1 Tax=Acinetobacter guillouiae TaxID=106649 RepID=UPI003AF45A11
MTTINNLTKHDSPEFKVGDLVVSKDKNDQALYEIKRIHHNKIDGWDYLYLKNSMYKNSGERGDYADKYTLATPEEIKAGHRLDQAPKTCGWDLASGKDWSAVPVLDRGEHE